MKYQIIGNAGNYQIMQNGSLLTTQKFMTKSQCRGFLALWELCWDASNYLGRLKS